MRALRAMRRRWWVMVLCVGLGAVVGAVGSVALDNAQPATYRATSVLLADGLGGPPPNTSPYAWALFGGGVSNLRTIQVIATLQPTVSDVADRVGLTPDQVRNAVSTQIFTEKRILSITATTEDPDRSVRIASVYVDALTEQLTALRRAASHETITRLESQLRYLKRHHRQIGPIRSQIHALRVRGGTPVSLEVLQEPYAVETTPSGLSVPASTPVRILIGALLGLLVGIVLVLALDRLDARIWSEAELASVSTLPVLADIPPLRSQHGVVVTLDPLSDAAGAFRLLAAAVLSAAASRPSEEGLPGAITVLVTSAHRDAGRTTITANLAASFAERGSRVVAMSCDFRTPRLHERFGVAGAPGLLQFLEDRAMPKLPETVVAQEPTALAVVASGGTSDRPAELLGGIRMRTALELARGIADVVVIDAPPLVGEGDSLPLLTLVDVVLVVARMGITKAGDLAQVREILRTPVAPFAGVVANEARHEAPSPTASPPSRRQISAEATW